jgi:hypothetical protein
MLKNREAKRLLTHDVATVIAIDVAVEVTWYL